MPGEYGAVVPDGPLVAVHAHPDDETLSSGALLATWARAGWPVTVVTCTRGERGEVIATPGTPTEHLGSLEGDGPALAAHRERELAQALRCLGVRDHAFLDTCPQDGAAGLGAQPLRRYEDSGMVWAAPGRAVADPTSGPAAFTAADLDEAAAALVRILTSRAASVVVTYEPGGGYGHPDHVRAHEITVRAMQMLESAGTPAPQLWCIVTPEGVMRESRRELREIAESAQIGHRMLLPDPDEPLPSVAKPEDRRGDWLAVAVEPVLDAVIGALRAHATQVQHVGAVDRVRSAPTTVLGWYALSNDIVAAIPTQEFYEPYRFDARTFPRSVGRGK